MDVHMPKVSGFDATLRMREMEMDKGLPRCALERCPLLSLGLGEGALTPASPAVGF